MLVQLGLGEQLELGLSRINRAFFILICIVLPNDLFGQENANQYLLQKQKKIGLELIGASYRGESPIRKRLTRIFHGGLQYSFVLSSGNITARYSSSLDAVVASGLRYYYNISPESQIINHNIGKYFELDLGVKSGSIISKNMYYPPYIFLRPHWGMQFSPSSHLSMEFGAGLTIGSNVLEGYKGVGITPNIQLRIGYIFKKKQGKNDIK